MEKHTWQPIAESLMTRPMTDVLGILHLFLSYPSTFFFFVLYTVMLTGRAGLSGHLRTWLPKAKFFTVFPSLATKKPVFRRQDTVGSADVRFFTAF